MQYKYMEHTACGVYWRCEWGSCFNGGITG